MKYKFVETTGCTAFSFAVDGENFYDLTKDKQEEILDYLLEKVRESINHKEIGIADLVKLFQETDYSCETESCDQCGDLVAWTTWEI